MLVFLLSRLGYFKKSYGGADFYLPCLSPVPSKACKMKVNPEVASDLTFPGLCVQER